MTDKPTDTPKNSDSLTSQNALHHSQSALLLRLRELIEYMVSRLEDYVLAEDLHLEDRKAYLGERETVLSALTKLSQILFKHMPMERELDALKQQEQQLHTTLSQEDMEIIRQFLEGDHDEFKRGNAKRRPAEEGL